MSWQGEDGGIAKAHGHTMRWQQPVVEQEYYCQSCGQKLWVHSTKVSDTYYKVKVPPCDCKVIKETSPTQRERDLVTLLCDVKIAVKEVIRSQFSPRTDFLNLYDRIVEALRG